MLKPFIVFITNNILHNKLPYHEDNNCVVETILIEFHAWMKN